MEKSRPAPKVNSGRAIEMLREVVIKPTAEDRFEFEISIPAEEWKKYTPEQRRKMYQAMAEVVVASCRTKKQLREAARLLRKMGKENSPARKLAGTMGGDVVNNTFPVPWNPKPPEEQREKFAAAFEANSALQRRMREEGGR